MALRKILDLLAMSSRIIRFNFRIIFANRFVWFLLAALAFYVGLSLIEVFGKNQIKMEDMYSILLFSGILIIFYPTVFGIQNDQDARTIEIIFGIPNYRYKVWLVRVSVIFLLTFLILIALAVISSTLIVKFRILDMAGQVMIPLLMLGTMAFMMSTVVRNGNGTAVIMIIFGLLFWAFSDTLEQSRWNVFHNPFKVPSGVSEIVWRSISEDNRIILASATILFILAALFNLRKREKFM